MASDRKYSIKSCGKAHAYCKTCRPEVAEALSGPKPPPRADLPPCRNCGRCNKCLGLTAPDGMRVCRKCRETQTLDRFRKKGANRDRASICKACDNQEYINAACKNCGRIFWRSLNGYTAYCTECIKKIDRPCARCGSPFVASMAQKKFCSEACRAAEARDVRKRSWMRNRDAILHAYGGACACCGESERAFLAIDHIDGGGHKQYKALGGGGFSSWVRKNNYPDTLRLLCHNCNFGRQQNGGICPHEQK